MKRFWPLLFLVPLAHVFLPKWFRGDTDFPVTKEKPFVLIVPAYNCAPYIDRNLRSIYSQNYTNYRVIYIDDFSSDDTLERAKDLIIALDKREASTLIHNRENKGSLANIFDALTSCSQEEIAVIVHCDDALAHENVLTRLNEHYANPNIWATCGGSLAYPSFKREESHHLKTFLVPLALSIEETHRMAPMGGGLILLTSISQLAGKHLKKIDDVLYLHNTENPIGERALNPDFQDECISNLSPSYKPLPIFPSPTL